MKQRLPAALSVAVLAGLIGLGVAIWIGSDHLVGIVIVSAVIGFVFGLFFKFRIV